jgi:hypothetical protein
MKLENIIRPTSLARPGMTVLECFTACLQDGVPGIPYVDKNGNIAGRFSIRETLRRACIPDVMVNYAELLGDSAGCLQIPEQHAKKLLALPIEPFVSGRKAEISPHAAVAKAVALMEKHSANYLFVTDDSHYLGIVTIWAIAQRMLDIA